MKKTAIALALSLAATSAFAKEPGKLEFPNIHIPSRAAGGGTAPGIVIAGGLGTSGFVLGALGILVLPGTCVTSCSTTARN